MHYQTPRLMGKTGGWGGIRLGILLLQCSANSRQSLANTGIAGPAQRRITMVLCPDTHTAQLWPHTERHLVVLSYRITSPQQGAGEKKRKSLSFISSVKFHSYPGAERKVLLLPWRRKIYILPQNQLLVRGRFPFFVNF